MASPYDSDKNNSSEIGGYDSTPAPPYNEKNEKQSAPAPAEMHSEKPNPWDLLPPDEVAILKSQVETAPAAVNYFGIYRYSGRAEMITIIVCTVCAIAAGAALPLMTIVFGQMSGNYALYFQGKLPGDQFIAIISHYALYYIYLAVGEFFTCYIATVGFIWAGGRITQRFREAYLNAILRQNIGFFDKMGSGEITTRITADMNTVQDGISQKVSLTLTAVSTFVVAFVIGFIKNWLLTLCLCSTLVGIVTTMGVCVGRISKHSRRSIIAYAAGGNLAEEVLSSIRNAVAFGTESRLAALFDKALGNSEGHQRKSYWWQAGMWSLVVAIIYSNYGFAFWEGSRLLVRHETGITLTDVVTILLSVMFGSFSIGTIAPYIQAFVACIAAANKVFATIQRKSPIDVEDGSGKILQEIRGNIELQGVKFIYPSRPDVTIMDDVSLNVPAGKVTALVGPSGSGKSTIVGLTLRLYDPVRGRMLLDGVDIRDINVRFLRQHIALVGQEPTLFACTIFENICHGLIGTQYENADDQVKKQLVENAAVMANAHGFISELPEAYNTNVGQKGFLLSGGQKQRIAIARAVVSDPKILLLDEATSALDTKSEGVVQAALDKASQGRTTIVIAHRLSTIRNADNIVVMAGGKLVEQGNHDQLLDMRGVYANLVTSQKIAQANEQPDAEDEDDPEEQELNEQLALAQTNRSNARKSARISTRVSARISARVSARISGRVSSRIPSSRISGMRRSQIASIATTDFMEDDDLEIEASSYSLSTILKFLVRLNQGQYWQIILGFIGAVINGGCQPVQSVLFAKSITVFSLPPSQYGQLESGIAFWAWMYFMLGWVVLLAQITMNVPLYLSSARLIHRVRDMAFRAMLRQDIAFFDHEENTAGALTSFLATESTAIAGLSGATLGTIIAVITTLIASFCIALAIGWKMALVCICTVPVLLSCGYLRFRMLSMIDQKLKAGYQASAAYACEATSAIRTVASLTREKDVFDNYSAQLTEQNQKSLVDTAKASIFYALSQSLTFCCFALAFWYGATLVGHGEYSEFQFFVVYYSIIFGAQSAGTVFAFAPDMSKTRSAASALKALFDRTPAIDTWSEEGERVPTTNGHIKFEDVHFRYPTRPTVPVLRGVNLDIKPGEYVALVGGSGCGKSTSIGLIERFYDPLIGRVTLDGQDIADLNVNEYRSQIALVSQEPTLYQGTIRDNILLGLAPTTDPATVGDDQVIKACQDSNIWSFIQSLPDGLNTDLGNKGTMLSGGQKQRVAIARALLRDPKILLLDEATSALDSESEKIVQGAIDKAAKGRTTISIAHRLSTIQNADKIYVFEAGKIVEVGNHQDLMAKQGRYFDLVQMQNVEKKK